MNCKTVQFGLAIGSGYRPLKIFDLMNDSKSIRALKRKIKQTDQIKRIFSYGYH